MIDQLIQLPGQLPMFGFIAAAVIGGLLIYLASWKIIEPRRPSGIRQPTREIIRVVGLLLSLFLSLTFADVLIEMNKIKSSIEREVTVISEIYEDLNRYGIEHTRPIHEQLETYVRSVVEDEWPKLAQGQLSDETGAMFRSLETSVLLLEPETSLQAELRQRLLSDLDGMSESRLTRLQQALTTPPLFLVAVLIGFIVLMICIGIYEPSPVLLVFLGLMNAFIGVVTFLIVAISDPFKGATGVDASVFELLLWYMEQLRPTTYGTG